MHKMNNKKITYGIVYGLVILAILAFGVIIIPVKANAQTSSYDTGFRNRTTLMTNDDRVAQFHNPLPFVSSISPNSANLGENAKTITITGYGFVPNSIARFNGSNRPTTFIDYSHLLIHLNASDMQGSSGRYINVFNPAPDGGYSNSVFFTINGYVISDAQTTAQNSNTSTVNSNADNANNANSANLTKEQVSNEESASSLVSNVIFGSTSFMPSGVIQWIFFAILILVIVILVRKIFGAEKKYQETPLKYV